MFSDDLCIGLFILISPYLLRRGYYYFVYKATVTVIKKRTTFAVGRELYGLFHVPDAAMPRDTAGQLMSPWNLVQSVLADEVTLNFVVREI
jgi:hypothetical protein